VFGHAASFDRKPAHAELTGHPSPPAPAAVISHDSAFGVRPVIAHDVMPIARTRTVVRGSTARRWARVDGTTAASRFAIPGAKAQPIHGAPDELGERALGLRGHRSGR
jgi:hypothetical protein